MSGCNPINFPGGVTTVDNTGGIGQLLVVNPPAPAPTIKTINGGTNITVTTLGVAPNEYIEISAAGAGTVTLQDAYDASTGGATPEIVLDTTRNAVNIQGDTGDTVNPLFTVDRGSGGALNGDFLTVGQDFITAASGSTSGTPTGSIVIGAGSNSGDTNNHIFGPGNTANSNSGVSILSDGTGGLTAVEDDKIYLQKENGLLLSNGPTIPTTGAGPFDGNYNINTFNTASIPDTNSTTINSYLSDAGTPAAYYIRYRVIGIESAVVSPRTIASVVVETIAQFDSLPIIFPPTFTIYNPGLSVTFAYVAPNIVATLTNNSGVAMRFYIVEEIIEAI